MKSIEHRKKPMQATHFIIVSIFSLLSLAAEPDKKPHQLPTKNLMLDLDATKGVELAKDGKVTAWHNRAAGAQNLVFISHDKGRKEAGSGRPTLRTSKTDSNTLPSIIFRRQELVCMDEDVFDGLTTGKGHTWIAVISVYPQQPGLKDVNSFFGNLRNGGKYAGVWGGLNDDNTVWWGTRNGLTFGRFDQNNPQLIGPKLEQGKWHIVAGRMAAGTGSVELNLFVNSHQPVATATFPVNPEANPSKMAIGQERDAIEHPGLESFDGEIARFLIWERPLEDAELATSIDFLHKAYLDETDVN